MIYSQPKESWQRWPSKTQYLKQQNAARLDYIFVPYFLIINNRLGFERLRTVKKHIFYDRYAEGIWIKRKSTAHSLAIILGFTDEKEK
jgi:hypothetical protein